MVEKRGKGIQVSNLKQLLWLVRLQCIFSYQIERNPSNKMIDSNLINQKSISKPANKSPVTTSKRSVSASSKKTGEEEEKGTRNPSGKENRN